jgi:putative sterol carrier protein
MELKVNDGNENKKEEKDPDEIIGTYMDILLKILDGKVDV